MAVPTAGRQRAAAAIDAALQRASHLSRQLLTLATLDEARAGRVEAVDLAALVQQALAQAAPLALARGLDVSPLLAALLIRRGCDTPEAARIFLDAPLSALHDPWRMLGMDAAVDRLRAAVARRWAAAVAGGAW